MRKEVERGCLGGGVEMKERREGGRKEGRDSLYRKAGKYLPTEGLEID